MKSIPLPGGFLQVLLLAGFAAVSVEAGTEMPLRVGNSSIQRVTDRSAFARQLRADAYSARGGVDRHEIRRSEGHNRTFPYFSSSFRYGGTEYPYTMVGYPPESGRTARIRSVIVPLRLNFVGFEQDITFEPGRAVDNIVRSPIYNDAKFPNGIGQYGDQLQRATFWNKMDAKRNWHVKMEPPRITRTFDVQVTPGLGALYQLGSDPATSTLGVASIELMDSLTQTMVQTLELQPDELPIFVTYNSIAQALGYHTAYPVRNGEGYSNLQTLIYTSWLDTDLLGELLADISTLNHEVAEWLNDPFTNNVVPTWTYPPFNVTCSDNNLLEVGDPQGNGPEYYLFPVIPMKLNGFTYHLQDCVMLPWFAGEVPSSAQNGWYDFPGLNQILSPAVLCNP